MTWTPLVTVFTAVYNRAPLVSRAIDSVLRQSFTDFELLIIDDGSTDDSVEVVRRYRDPRIRLLENGINLGIAPTRRRGLDEARGTFLAVLDSDDAATPRRLERQVRYLRARPGVAVVGGWAKELKPDGHLRRRVKPLPLGSAELKARLLFRTCHHHSSTMSRTSVLREYGYDPNFPLCEDYDLFERIGHRHELGNIPHVLVHRGIHPGRITTERAAEVRQLNMAIAGRQLDRLGMPTDQASLARHFAIARVRKEGMITDAAFLHDTAAWLHAIMEANRRTQTYAAAPLAAVLGQLWLVACFHARRTIGTAALGTFFGSSLSGAVPATLARNFAAALGRS